MIEQKQQYGNELKAKAERLFPGNAPLQSRWMVCVAADHFAVREGNPPRLLMHGAPAKWKGYAS